MADDDQVVQPIQDVPQAGFDIPIPPATGDEIDAGDYDFLQSSSPSRQQPSISITPPTESPTWSTFNDDGHVQESSLLTPAGGLTFRQEVRGGISFKGQSGDEVLDNLAQDNSYVSLSDKMRGVIELRGGNATVKAQADLYLGSRGNSFTSIAGDSQRVIQGDDHVFVHGDKTEQIGDASEEKIEAAKKAQEITHEIDKKKVETIEKTKGSDVECPTCSMEVATDSGQCLIDLAFRLIRYAIPNFPYPLDILQSILNFLSIPFMDSEKVKDLNGGEGCGSPGCKNGMVKSMQEGVQTANEEAAKELESKEKELGEAQKKQGSGGSKVFGPFMGDVAFYVGHPEATNQAPTVAFGENATIPFGFTNEKSGKGFIPNSNGNCLRAIHTDPLINPGSFSFHVAQKLTIKSGSPGMELMTSGRTQLIGSTTNVIASQGELTLASNNVTTVKGKNIIIDGNDLSGDNGVRIEAQNTMVGGALHVSGDLAVKGAISMDGGLYCTHITCPGERVATGPSGPAHQVHSGGTWNNPINGLQATVLDEYDKDLKKVGRDVFNVLSLNIINGMAEIKTLIEEAYETVKLNMIVDNYGLPTGFGTTYFAPPGAPAGPPLMVNGFAMAGPFPVVFLYTFVVPGQTFPVHGFTHNHLSPGSNHSHDYTSFQGMPVGDNASARAARPNPSHVPSPPKATGIGTKPGHKNVGGGLCLPCIWPFGGGGSNTGGRNAAYGFDPNAGNNLYNGTNYVTASSINYASDGTLIPPPFLNINC